MGGVWTPQSEESQIKEKSNCEHPNVTIFGGVVLLQYFWGGHNFLGGLLQARPRVCKPNGGVCKPAGILPSPCTHTLKHPYTHLPYTHMPIHLHARIRIYPNTHTPMFQYTIQPCSHLPIYHMTTAGLFGNRLGVKSACSGFTNFFTQKSTTSVSDPGPGSPKL